MQAFRRRGGACERCSLPIGKLEAELAVALAETRMCKEATQHRLTAVEVQLESLGFNLRKPLWKVRFVDGQSSLFCSSCEAKNVIADSSPVS